MKRSRLIFWLTALAGVCPLAAQSGLSPFDETRYVGNVIGSVIDSKTGRGIRGASVQNLYGDRTGTRIQSTGF
jgi:hypothetical protein